MNSQQLDELEAKFKDMPVLVLGDIMIDASIYCEPHKLSQEAPVPVMRQIDANFAPGGAANVAMMCAALGANVTLFGRWYRPDDYPESLLSMIDHLENFDIDYQGVFHDSSMQCTPTKLRIWAGLGGDYQQLVRIDEEEPKPLNVPMDFLSDEFAHCRNFGDWKIVLISDYGKGFCQPDVFRLLPRRSLEDGTGIRYVDPPDRPDWSQYYKLTVREEFDYFIPNEKKAGDLSAKELAERLDAGVVVTQGSRGCDVATTSRLFATHHHPPVVHRPVDVTGCGDQFLAMFAMTQYCLGINMACQLANIAAGIQVTRLGCQPVTMNAIRTMALQQRDNHD